MPRSRVAAIGGKTAVDLPAGKNLIGAFHQPRLVLCDLRTLDTLDPRERRAALAELLKHALLDGETALAELESMAERLRDDPPYALFDVVRRSIAYKASVVVPDPREQRSMKRRPRATSRPVALQGREMLNLGHTVGHAIEIASHDGPTPLRHGEAVGLGLLAEARIGRTLNLWPAGPSRIGSLLPRLGLPHALDDLLRSLSVERVRGALGADKKQGAGSGQIVFVLLDTPGRALGVPLGATRALEILLGEKAG
jgi:3-dehydroquinate synthetase